MPIGGLNPYPAIADVTNLTRSMVQDDMAGATSTIGEGQIFVDNQTISVTMGNFFNSAVRSLSRLLRMTSAPMLIRDNWLILGVPPLYSPSYGLATPDPAVQVQLGYTGYNNGQTVDNTWALPIDCILVDRVWERINGSNDDFQPMEQPSQGIASRWQNVYNRVWEWRQDSIFMPGSIETMDLRLRYKMQLPTLYTAAIDPTMTYVPINDSQDALTGLVIKQIAIRQGAQVLPAVIEWADAQINEFLNENTLREQGIPYPVVSFGDRNSSDDLRRY